MNAFRSMSVGERRRAADFSAARKIARKTLTPLGYFFLSEPPEEKLPIPDFRMLRDRPVKRDRVPRICLETIIAMQRRQDWMREYLQDLGVIHWRSSIRNAAVGPLWKRRGRVSGVA